MNFEEQLFNEIKTKLIREVKQAALTKVEYGDRISIPNEVLEQVWSSIDWTKVIEQIKPAIETRVCNAIIGAMETEIKTDIKKVLAVDGVRQRLRMEVYPKLMQVLNDQPT